MPNIRSNRIKNVLYWEPWTDLQHIIWFSVTPQKAVMIKTSANNTMQSSAGHPDMQAVFDNVMSGADKFFGQCK